MLVRIPMTDNQSSNYRRQSKYRFNKCKLLHRATALISAPVRAVVQEDLGKAGLTADEIEAATAEATSIFLKETTRMRNAFTAELKKAFFLTIKTGSFCLPFLFCAVLLHTLWSNHCYSFAFFQPPRTSRTFCWALMEQSTKVSSRNIVRGPSPLPVRMPRNYSIG
jgi:hypothetical protein